MDSTQTQPNKPKSTGSTFVSNILSVVAIGISGAAITLHYLDNPLGKGAKHYDFSTAQASFLSNLQIIADNDVRAQMELSELMNGEEAREKRTSVQVTKEHDFRGKKFLFFTYTRGGIPKRDVQAFERHVKSGYWYPTEGVPLFINRDDKELDQMGQLVTKWKEKGTLE